MISAVSVASTYSSARRFAFARTSGSAFCATSRQVTFISLCAAATNCCSCSVRSKGGTCNADFCSLLKALSRSDSISENFPGSNSSSCFAKRSARANSASRSPKRIGTSQLVGICLTANRRISSVASSQPSLALSSKTPSDSNARA